MTIIYIFLEALGGDFVVFCTSIIPEASLGIPFVLSVGLPDCMIYIRPFVYP